MPDAFHMSLRKFLKRLGVTGQQAIEESVRRARAEGTLPESGTLPVQASIRIGDLDLVHTVEGEIRLDDRA